MPSYGGTLAAARSLGEHGVPVTMAVDDDRLAPARWSRYVTRVVKAPPVIERERFLDWLLEFGQREPGYVFYPTCDDLAWLVAEHAAELGKYYRLYTPTAQAVLDLLDKKSLYELCAAEGLPVLPTVFPESAEEAARLGPSVGFPLLVKPRTQIYLPTRSKGDFVAEQGELAKAFDHFLADNPFHPALCAARPGIERPMLQAFRSDAAENIYSISGFIGRETQGDAVRASVKVLQRPRRIGVGLCFEEAPVNREILDGLARICHRIGFFGVFEAEFVPYENKLHLIDFNPRFYGQMGFEIARSLPLPYLTWLGALGEEAELTAALEKARRWEEGQGYVYCYRFFFHLMLSLQRLSGWLSEEEHVMWQEWLAEPTARGHAFDPMQSATDPRPGQAAATRDVVWALSHPRSFLRQMVFGP
jgi:predicted ATP-grasp superfamily ATP-dependent carboligase